MGWAAAREGLGLSKKDSDTESTTTDSSTVATVSPVVLDEAAVESMAMADKDVKKLVKSLRDIEKLVERISVGIFEPDTLQKAKLAKKADVEIALDTAVGL